jgi:hypothetical protein
MTDFDDALQLVRQCFERGLAQYPSLDKAAWKDLFDMLLEEI